MIKFKCDECIWCERREVQRQDTFSTNEYMIIRICHYYPKGEPVLADYWCSKYEPVH